MSMEKLDAPNRPQSEAAVELWTGGRTAQASEAVVITYDDQESSVS